VNKLTKYESQQLRDIKKWQREEPGVVARASGLLSEPLVWLTKKVIPEASIRGALDGSNSAAIWLTDSKDILRDAKVLNVAAVGDLELQAQDALANEVHNWAIGIATAEGAATGATGLPGLLADMPVLVTLSLRTIHKIGLCYGYEATSTRDNQFVYGVLAASGANSVGEKVSALLLLRSLEVVLSRQTFKAMSEKAVQSVLSKESAIISLRSLAKSLGVNLTRRKALAAIPVIGAAVGGTANGWWMKEVGWAARHAFQRRRLVDAGKLEAGDELA